MTRTVLTYYPPGGAAEIMFTTGDAAAYRLISLDGIGPVQLQPQSIKSPGQTGSTAVDVGVPPRIVVVQARLQASTADTLWTTRAALARAVVIQPVRLGEEIVLGRLRLALDGRPALELDCLPQSTDLPRPRGQGVMGTADLEFFAPYPYWREVTDSRLIFTTEGGGFGFPLEFEIEMLSNNVEQEVDNLGDVDAPPLIRIYGEAENVRMLNTTTGEAIEILQSIADGEYVEIETAFGKKAVTLVDAMGARTSIMDKLNLSIADFWMLRPGINVVRFEADTNTSGHAEMFWRQRYSGV